jgi:hypothetical protein
VAFELNAPSGSCDTILICPDGAESTLTSTGTILAGFSASEKGLYRLKFSGGEEVAFEIVDDDDDPNIIKIDIDAGSRATSDLADRKVTLRFNSIASVQEAEIQLTLLCDGRVERHVQDILPDTPCRIDGSHSIWERLLDTDTVERLLGSRRAELFVEVSGLLKTSFAFDQVVAPFAWAKRPDGTMAAYDETGELMIFATTPEHPTKPSSTSGSVPEFDIQLLRAGRDQPSQAGGICIGSGTWRAGDALAVKRPERLMRQFSGESNNAVYGRDMVDALISWSAATVDNPVIQYRRGQIVRELENWLIEQFCGTAWSKQEQALNARRETSFIRSFLSACAQLGIGYGDVVVSASHDSHLNRILVRLIKTSGVFKKIEIDREPISEDIAIKLDDIFNEAYTLLYEELVAQGEPCSFDPDKDVDVGEISENWERAIARATSAEALPEMVALLRPLDAGDALSMADFEAMPPDEVIDLLDAWITKNSPAHHARNWNRDLVEAAYWLFTRPALVARLPWTTVTERLLADSFTARAIRYAALRAGSGSKFE